MSSPIGANYEDEVEFVSEAPLRPVLECIDLLSDGEDDGSLPTAETIEDEIDRQKAQVTSTLDRLARQVAVAKKERAEKCKAFKEKQISQKAHGRQELAFSPNGNAYDSKRCVDMWLKMPGVKPGVINTGASWRRRQVPFPTSSSSTHTCPVINCGRVYDNVPLLEGHLKRFDHSPCDPTIYLKGSPTELFACVACGLHFETKEAWKVHQQSKLSSPDEDHDHTQTCQPIVCFACPACYLLFYIRDECLQHMSAKSHFSQSIIMSETKGTALPVPFPRYAKNRLIALCKEVSFSVRCTTCQKGLNSHMEAQAHFNVQCRQGAARAEAEKTVVQVMKQLQVLGQCAVCCKLFLNQGDVERHKELSQHNTEVNCTMEKAILHYSNFYEIQHAKRAAATSRPKQSKGPVTPSWKRDKERGDSVGSPAKRQRREGALNGSAGTSRSCLIVAWFCECGQRFSEEAMASKHLFAANRIFHQCGVCGKHMGESSITRLHMSRFHGGAHLSNFLFHCRLCKVDMPRHEDILLHVSEAHSGHTYFREREVSDEEPAPIPYAKPSTSGRPSALTDIRTRTTTPTPLPKQDERWICRMCEDIFNSEQAVHKHCRDVSNHSFQRFACGHCPQKYFKEATVRRHCVNEHSNQIVTRYFCGLCDSMEKQGMSDRVVDDLNPVLTFTRKEVESLLHFAEEEPDPTKAPPQPHKEMETVISQACQLYPHLITKEPFHHESLLVDRKESKLTKAEKRAAKKSYEDEKRASVPYSRPSYAHYYPTSDQTLINIPAFNQRNWRPIARGDEKPVASVRPVQSTPIPMMPRMAGMGVAGSSSGVGFPVNYLQKAGVYVQRIVTTTDIVIPGANSTTDVQARIGAGESIHMIKGSKGTYIKTNDGRIFAIRSGKLSRAVQGGTATNRGSQVSLLHAIGNGCSSPGERQRLTPDSALWPSTPEILRELSRYAVTADTVTVGNELPSPSDTFTGDRGGGGRMQQHNQTTESDHSRQFREDVGMSISEALQRSKRKMAESRGHKQGGKRSSTAAGFPGLSLGSGGLSFPPMNQALEGHMSHPLLMGGNSSSPFLQSAGQTLGDLQAMFPSAGADLLNHASSATGSNGHLPSSTTTSTNTMPVSSASTTLPPYLMNPSVADLLSPGFPLNYSQSLLPDPRMYPNTLGGGPASSGGSSSFLSHYPSSPSSLLGAALSRPDTHHMATDNGGSSSDDDVIEVTGQ